MDLELELAVWFCSWAYDNGIWCLGLGSLYSLFSVPSHRELQLKFDNIMVNLTQRTYLFMDLYKELDHVEGLKTQVSMGPGAPWTASFESLQPFVFLVLHRFAPLSTDAIQSHGPGCGFEIL